MKTYLITGAAGFIGANFIKYMLAKYPDIKIVVLDLLTYAGNLGTIAEDIDGERCEFVSLFLRRIAMWTSVSRIRCFFWSRIYLVLKFCSILLVKRG